MRAFEQRQRRCNDSEDNEGVQPTAWPGSRMPWWWWWWWSHWCGRASLL